MIAPHRTAGGPEETRLKILTAAREIFEKNGTRGTTTREVAERAGVNEATLFRHFGTKQALLDAMREEACGHGKFREMIASLSGDLESDLRMVARFAVTNMAEKRAMMCVQLAEDAADPNLPGPVWRGPQQFVERLSEYLAGHAEAGRLRGDPIFLARVFMGQMFSVVVARKLWEGVSPDPATIDGIVDVFLHGVTK